MTDDSGGENLIKSVIHLTELPQDLIEKELLLILQSKGISPENLTMTELRAALLEYLENFNTDFNQLS